MRNWLIVPAAVLASGIVAFALLGMSGTGTKPAAAKAKGKPAAARSSS